MQLTEREQTILDEAISDRVNYKSQFRWSIFMAVLWSLLAVSFNRDNIYIFAMWSTCASLNLMQAISYNQKSHSSNLIKKLYGETDDGKKLLASQQKLKDFIKKQELNELASN